MQIQEKQKKPNVEFKHAIYFSAGRDIKPNNIFYSFEQ